jgi:hypothetical protein
MVATDLHQHLWPDPLLRLLSKRTAPPRLKREDGGWQLELAGEPPSRLDVASHDPAARLGDADRIIVGPSTPLGIEALPAREGEAFTFSASDIHRVSPPAGCRP